MNVLESFIAYADDFEKTYDDDDWHRLEQYFSPDAIYRVHSQLMGCELQGPNQIFKGLKKSLDGFDRIFPKRKIAVSENGLEIKEDSIAVEWLATYVVDGHRDLQLAGRSEATYKDGVIALLEDSYTKEAESEVSQWVQETGMSFDASYT